MKEKLMLDAGIFVLLLLCMEYDATGSFLHELIGVILIAGLLFHIAVNRKYYKSVKPDRIQKLSKHGKVSLVLNILLPVSLAAMLVSSCVISKDIFRFLNIETGNYEFWRVLHIVSACVMLLTSFVHILMHIKMFRALIKKNTKSESGARTAGVFSCVAAAVAGAIVLKSGVHYISDDIIGVSGSENEPSKIQPSEVPDESQSKDYPAETKEKSESEEKSENKEKPDNEENSSKLPFVTEQEIRDAVDEMITESETYDEETVDEQPVADIPTLEEYLGKLVCTGCGRRCCLLSPQCGKGERQAAEAESDYNSTYSN